MKVAILLFGGGGRECVSEEVEILGEALSPLIYLYYQGQSKTIL